MEWFLEVDGTKLWLGIADTNEKHLLLKTQAPIFLRDATYWSLFDYYHETGHLLSTTLSEKLFESNIIYIDEKFKKLLQNPGKYSPEKLALSKVKQYIDQNNTESYILFSRHPIDVLRMSDHPTISSCHGLDKSQNNCTFDDARNMGGVVYVLYEKDIPKIKSSLPRQLLPA